MQPVQKIDINLPKRRRTVFIWFLAMFLPLFILAGSVVSLLYYKEIGSVQASLETEESRHVARQRETVGNELKSIISDLMLFSDHSGVQQALERGTEDTTSPLATEILNFIRLRERYRQIRLVDASGREIVKVVFEEGRADIFSNEALQAIENKDAFKEVLKLDRNELYFSAAPVASKIDGKQTSPGVFIRAGIPFPDRLGGLQGTLIFEYDSTVLVSLLEQTRSQDVAHYLLLHSDGSVISQKKDNEPAAVPADILVGTVDADSGQFYGVEGLYTFATIYPYSEAGETIRRFGNIAHFGTEHRDPYSEGWKLVSFIPRGFFSAPSRLFLRRLILSYLIFTIFLTAGSYILARVVQNRKIAEMALRESDIQIRNIVSTTLDGIIITNENGIVELFNPAAEQIFGCKADEVIGKSVNHLIPKPSNNDQTEYLPHCLDIDERDGIGARHEVMGQRKDGTRFPIELAVSEVRLDERKLFTGIVRDITDRKKMEEKLRYKAFHDALTSLPNRSFLMNRLERSIKLAKTRKGYLFAVLFLDLDRFKVINDSLGHAIGDRLLVAIARRLERCLRPGDTVARLGGDELAVLLEDVGDVSFAKRVSERIHKDLALPFNINGHEIFNTVSIGITLSSTGYDKPEDVLRDADIAMYRAKLLGKSRHEVFDRTMHNRAVALQQLETDLRRAVGQNEFQLYYQPIVSLESEGIIGFEALVRWNHPERGLIPPDQFIPLAEETRLIIPIGNFVLYEACRQMREWQRQFQRDRSLEISVNLSFKQFLQPNIVEKIKQVLYETGLNPYHLRLEITESFLMEDVESINLILGQLRMLNIRLDIDDFGTGYSSLSYLHQFPFNALKVDRSFTARIGDTGENLEMVKMIVALAHNFGMEVIVEGVEKVEQLRYLRLLNCEYGQGYYFSKPLDCQAATAMIASNEAALKS